jgi:hypothetical protein
MAAPQGNQNALKGKVWNDALRKAIVQDNGNRVRAAIEQLLDNAAAGEQWAIKELADRLDGKSAQSVAITDPDGGVFKVEKIVRQIVDSGQ